MSKKHYFNKNETTDTLKEKKDKLNKEDTKELKELVSLIRDIEKELIPTEEKKKN